MIFQHAGRATVRLSATQRVALSQLGFSRVNAVSNANRSSLLALLSPTQSPSCPEARRCYATAPAPSSAPSKAPAKKKTTTTKKKSTTKKAGAKKSGRAKKKTKATSKAKKPAAAKANGARKKKEPTEKQKLAAEKKKKNGTIRELRAQAQRAPRGLPATAFSVMLTETVRGSDKPMRERFREAAEKYKSLSPAEQEHYNHIANQNREKNAAARQRWVASLSPAQVHDANHARVRLRNMGIKGYLRIKDPRLVKKPVPAMMAFSKERHVSGDMKGIKISEAAKLIQREWQALSDAQKKPYYESELKAREQYVRDVKDVYGREVKLPADTTATRAVGASASP